MKRYLTTFFFVLLIAVCANAGTVKKSQNEEVKTSHLEVNYQKQTGILSLTILNGNQKKAIHVKHIELLMDGKLQKGFETVHQTSETELKNSNITVTLKKSGTRSVSVVWSANDHKRHQFNMRIVDNSNDRFYGGGERFNTINMRGFSMPMANDDRALYKGNGTYASIPFMMSSKGYGFMVENGSHGTFDMGSVDRTHLNIKYHDTYLKVVFLGGPNFKDILHEYTKLTGTPRIPPKWSFGFWKSRDVFQNRDSVLEDVHKLRKYHIPASVIVFDSPWETGYNNFEINAKQFSHPYKMFRTITKNGFYSALWYTPMINSNESQDMRGITKVSSNYKEAAEKGYLVHDSTGNVVQVHWWKGTGGIIDFTNPKAVKWWLHQIEKTQKLEGVRAFKLDDGEGDYVPNADYRDHTKPWQLTNKYSALYHGAVQSYVDSVFHGNGVLLNRAGFLGAQRYPFLWAGDNSDNFSYSDGLPTVILAGQNAGLSGVPFWGSDISGYIDRTRPTKQIFIRWAQFGAFSPFMQVHMSSNLGPWDFGKQALDIFRTYATWHTDLLPYLYNTAITAKQTGMPVIRAMALAFQNDPKAAQYPYQYMFGPDMLVAPMYRKGTWRSVYLPKGKWINYWTGNIETGPKDVEVHASLSQIPVFVKYGAVIPMLPKNIQTLVPRNPQMKKDIISLSDEPKRVLQIWPGIQGKIGNPNGIAAKFMLHGSEYTLTITNKKKRSIDVHFMYQKLKNMGYDLPLSYNTKKHMEILHLKAFSGTKKIMLLKQ